MVNWQEVLGMLLGGGAGKYMDNQNAKDSVSGMDALTGSGSKGIYGVQNRTNDMNAIFQKALSGQTDNPMLQGARTQAQNTMSNPIQPPQVRNMYNTGQAGNNPYMSQIQNQVSNPAGKQLRSNGVNSLFDQLMNRMGTRQRGTGTLTPYGK